MRDRSRVVLLQDGKVALMQRVRNGMTYYTFPGGGVENGETPEQAAIREAYEELGIQVQLQRLLATDRFNGVNSYFYLAVMTGGEFGTGTGPEYTTDRQRGSYIPVWRSIDELPFLDVRPRRIAGALASGALLRQP